MAKIPESKLTVKLELDTEEFYAEVERAKAALLELDRLRKSVQAPVSPWVRPAYPYYQPLYPYYTPTIVY